jgi:hypothetical protein
MELGRTSRKGRPALSNWVPVAELVRTLMARPPSPSLEEVATRFSHEICQAAGLPFSIRDKTRLKAATLRRFLSALVFLERFENEVAEKFAPSARALRGAPAAGVELIARWSTYDWGAAVAAAVKLAEGVYTVERLRRLEKEARGKATSAVKGRRYANQLRSRLQSWGREYLGGEYDALITVGDDEPPLDILYRRRIDGRRAGLVIFGPFSDGRIYRSRKTEFLALVVGCSMICERILAIVPLYAPEIGLDDYWSWLIANKAVRPNVEIFALQHFALGDLRPAALPVPSGAMSGWNLVHGG